MSATGARAGFEYYETPSEEKYDEAFAKALVVPDANVLLDFYRYGSGTRADLLNALGKAGDRLFVPHRVLEEFWRNRESALSDRAIMNPPVRTELDGAREKAEQSFASWANRVALGEEQRTSAQAQLRSAFDSVQTLIDDFVASEKELRERDTNRDSILAQIEQLVDGHVGEPLEGQELTGAIKEAARRATAGEPPGFRDAKKGDEDRVAGDYLVWKESVDRARSLGLDLLFVTSDAKEDWWHIVHGETRGPRIELQRELWQACGRRLYMVRPSRLISLHQRSLGQPDTDAVLQLRRAERAQEIRRAAWTPRQARSVLDELEGYYPAQHAAVVHAAGNGGFISRDDVYALGGYDPDRTLRGFTRPVNRIAQLVFDPEGAAEDPIEVFSSRYEADFSWVQAAGFDLEGSFAAAVLQAEQAATPDDRVREDETGAG